MTIPVSIGFLTAVNLITAPIGLAGAGIGVDIYCVMRQGGNDHEASWRAAYESIKNQKPGLFKTSPKQAAAMIVEAVVREPERFDGCISYLGDLYPKPLKAENNNISIGEEENNNTSKENYAKDRYSY
ncbi:DUF6554 family protein [Prochlorococcus marinus]|nr:DUF6554 family protein [Prochlorococcus marinus]